MIIVDDAKIYHKLLQIMHDKIVNNWAKGTFLLYHGYRTIEVSQSELVKSN